MKTPLQSLRKYIVLLSLVLSTTANTSAQVATLIQDVNTGSSSSFPSQLTYCSSYNCFFFVADNGSVGAELWKYDISSGVTSLVKDIYPGVASSSITAMVWYPAANVVVFGASDGVNGNELWKSDGTAAGTSMIMDINPGAASSA
ncbi:MAG: ELWxxDGT repeat protein, partial [Bacteroidia bacterium]